VSLICRLASILPFIIFWTTPVLSQDTSQNPVVHHSVSQTAVFPGDTIEYTLEIKLDSTSEIFLGDLDSSNLNLTGLESVSSEIEQNVTDEGKTYKAKYYLRSYDLDISELLIGERSIRYYSDQTSVSESGPQAEKQITIASTPVALRSTLPMNPESLSLRDHAPLTASLNNYKWMMYTGVGLVILSVLPVTVLGRAFVYKQIALMKERQQEKSPIQLPGILDELVKIDPDSASDRREGYNLLESILRTRLAQDSGVRAHSLTAFEANEYLPDMISGIAKNEIIRILEDCQHARYARPEYLPTVKQFEASVAVMQNLFVEA